MLAICYNSETFLRGRYRLGVRTEDSQSSNPGSIPGSATITAAITYAVSEHSLIPSLWPILWPPLLHRFGQLLIPALDCFPNQRHVRVVVDARGID